MLHSLHHFFTHNIGIKLASLILALAIYAHVLSSEDREGVFDVPIEVVGLPEGLTYEGQVPEEIPVRIQARGTELWKLRTQSLVVQIDLREARPGLLQRPVSTQDVVLPAGSDAQVEAILSPVVLSLQVEPLATRVLPVAVRLEEDLDPGWVRAGRATAEPETIRVEGPESRVESLDSLITEGIALTGRSHPLTARVRVVHPEGVWLAEDSVTVTVPVERLVQRALGPARVQLPAQQAGAWITEPDSVWVILEGPESLIEQVANTDVAARAILRNRVAEGAAVPIQPTVSARHRRLRTVGADPDTVTLLRRSR
jgi:YbbR domain-containing protein